MIPIQVQQTSRDFKAYDDIYDKLYNIELNKRMNTYPGFLATKGPEIATQFGKDWYNLAEWEKENERQDQLDQADLDLKKKQSEDYDRRKSEYEMRSKLRDDFMARYDELKQAAQGKPADSAEAKALANMETYIPIFGAGYGG